MVVARLAASTFICSRQIKAESVRRGGDGEGGLGVFEWKREGGRRALYKRESTAQKRKGEAAGCLCAENPGKEPSTGAGSFLFFFCNCGFACFFPPSHESKAILFKFKHSGGIDGVLSERQTKEESDCAPLNHVNPVDHNFGHHSQRR